MGYGGGATVTDNEPKSDLISASENRHRVANTLQLLAALARMRSQRASEPEARRQLLWMADVIGSIGTLEQKRRDGMLDFAAYLVEMAPVWRRRHVSQPPEVVVVADPLTVNDQTASTLILITQELVGNALRHGYPNGRAGVVTLRLTVDGAQCAISVEDDGDGFDPTSPDFRERFGLWLVRSLAAQVRGEFILSHNPGVTAKLAFKV